jgi:AcrR family transcriptional regulator
VNVANVANPKAPVTRQDFSARGNNRDRILETSLEMFNDRGVWAVSTSTIAAELGISPGNLYYHFANKEQIIRELWAKFDHDAQLVLRDPEEDGLLPPQRLAQFFVGVFDTIWRFRFIFRDADELSARDAEFGEAFRNEVEWGRQRLLVLFNSLIRYGAMRLPEDPLDLDRLSVNMNVVLLNWLRFLSLAEGKEVVGPDAFAEGGMQAFVMLVPYLETSYAKRTRRELEMVFRRA